MTGKLCVEQRPYLWGLDRQSIPFTHFVGSSIVFHRHLRDSGLRP